jgi:hypothetical protein
MYRIVLQYIFIVFQYIYSVLQCVYASGSCTSCPAADFLAENAAKSLTFSPIPVTIFKL